MQSLKTNTGPYISSGILVTSISSKVPLLKLAKNALRRINSKMKLYGADCKGNCVGKYFVDEFWEMPRTIDLTVKEVIQFAKENNIIGIIPTRDGELSFWSNYRDRLSENGINVMVSPSKSVSIFLDKLKFFRFAESKGLNVIQTSENIKDIKGESYVVKERFGSGSRSILVNADFMKASSYAGNLDNPIFQPYISGTEYSVDTYISKSGKIMGVVPRKRELVINGESQITSSVHDESIILATEELFRHLRVYGHQVLQYIKDDNNRSWLLECNSRYGGASSISEKCGLNTFGWFILESLGEKIDDKALNGKVKEIKQVRYPTDLYL